MSTPVKVGFVSLGCPKNTVDSEVMLGHLSEKGATLTADVDEAEVIVVNTCGFIEEAKAESIDAILEAAGHKKSGACRRLVVAGCMAHRYRQELEAEIPEIDAFLDLDGLSGVAAAAGLEQPAPGVAPVPRPVGLPSMGRTKVTGPGAAATTAPAAAAYLPSTYLYDAATPRRRTTPPWSAYIKIAEGCDNTCSFCAIPRFRGGFRSRPAADLVREARQLATEGVAELNLIAQDSTAYGGDLGLSGGPAALLEALSQVDGLRWIRLFYVYPNKVDDALLEVMAARDNVARYIDIPLQHASRTVLSRMRRGGSAESHLKLLLRIRRMIPGVAIRSTLITGFPGETEADFEQLCDFVREARFDSLGCFTYSHEEQTSAHDLNDDVAAGLKVERRERVMALQQSISTELSHKRLGGTFTVLCEGSCTETEHLLQGRLEGQAPEVDGRVLINDGEALPGHFVRVEITEAHPYDLVGRAVGPA